MLFISVHLAIKWCVSFPPQLAQNDLSVFYTNQSISTSELQLPSTFCEHEFIVVNKQTNKQR